MRTLFKHTARLLRRLTGGRYGWHGNYPSWQAATARCAGYQSQHILEQVLAATLQVKKGEAAYERDGVLFNDIAYSYPLLFALQKIAAEHTSPLHIIDFGGALGSSYFQNRLVLDAVPQLHWSVVEQGNFVSTGREQVADGRLQFYNTAEEAIAAHGKPQLLLISCTLQYIEKPYELLEHLLQLGAEYVMIDNTPFNYKNHDRITIQRVPPSIYNASYPCWFLNYEQVKERVLQRYRLVLDYTNELFIYLDGHKVPYRGLLAKQNN